jgi:DNA-binding transcriptional LysR family regulator
MGMELRQLRYFVAVAEQQHYGRAAKRVGVAQPAISRQIKNLEDELGLELFHRHSGGVNINPAGTSYLNDARRILQEIQDAFARAKRIATGQSGTLRVGYSQSLSWRGIVPDSLQLWRKRRPEVELQLKPSPSVDVIAAVLAGSLDAGYIYSMIPEAPELDRIEVASVDLLLAVPAGHALIRRKKIRLKDLIDVPLIWAPRWSNRIYYDLLMAECVRGGLRTPRIVQEVANEPLMLSLVACGVGAAFVSSFSKCGHPVGAVLLRVSDLKLRLPVALTWRKDNRSHLLAHFMADVKGMAARSARWSSDI